MAPTLIEAIENDDLSAFKALMQKIAPRSKKPKPTAVDSDGNTLLHLACKYSATNILSFLLTQSKVNVAATNTQGKTALHIASKYGNLPICQQLLKAGSNINATDISGKTPIHYATIKGHNNLIKLFLTNGADPNIYDLDLNTPLHYITGYLSKDQNNLTAVKLLLNHQADLHAHDKNNQTALQLSIHFGKTNVVNELLQRGALVTEISPYSLWHTIACGNTAIVVNLIKTIPELKLHCLGDDIIHLAAKHGHLDIIEALINNKVDLNILNIDNQTALNLACIHNQEHVAIALIKSGARLTTNNKSFWGYIKDHKLKKHLLPLLAKLQLDKFKVQVKAFMHNNRFELPTFVIKYYIKFFNNNIIIPNDDIRKFHHLTRKELLLELLNQAIIEVQHNTYLTSADEISAKASKLTKTTANAEFSTKTHNKNSNKTPIPANIVTIRSR